MEIYHKHDSPPGQELPRLEDAEEAIPLRLEGLCGLQLRGVVPGTARRGSGSLILPPALRVVPLTHATSTRGRPTCHAVNSRGTGRSAAGGSLTACYSISAKF